MKIVFLTIALDAMPFITLHYPEFRKLNFDWEWRIAEGVAAPVADTSWVRQMSPRLSSDGTTEYLDSIAAFDPRVILFRKSLWPGKVAMLNAALKTVNEPCLLMEIDSDEYWTAEQITKLRQMFIDPRPPSSPNAILPTTWRPEKNCAYFRCHYFVGRDIVITNKDGNHYGNNESYEWLRAWRFTPGNVFEKHEPPVLRGDAFNPFTHRETLAAGLVFSHYAYATEAAVAFKQEYYGSSNNVAGAKYDNAVRNWKRLQENAKWPVEDLSAFLPWVGPGVAADKIMKIPDIVYFQ